jgi:hypothetical protein
MVEELVEDILHALDAESGESYVDTKAKYIVESILPLVESYSRKKVAAEHLLFYKKSAALSKDDLMDWSIKRYPQLLYNKIELI